MLGKIPCAVITNVCKGMYMENSEMLLLWLYIISQVISSDGRCQLFHWLAGLTINASVSGFINFGVVILGLHQKTECGLDMNFLFEITEVTSVELYRNDFGIDTTERHSAVRVLWPHTERAVLVEQEFKAALEL